jgi:hypothetical protein
MRLIKRASSVLVLSILHEQQIITISEDEYCNQNLVSPSLNDIDTILNSATPANIKAL